MEFFRRAFPFLFLASLVLAAAAGVDFGPHWDEPKLFDAVRQAAATGSWLPGWYNYPSLLFDLNLAHFLALQQTGYDPVLFGRAITVLCYGLQGLVTFAIGRELARDWQGGAWALLAYGLSWEMLYHSKWVAVDTYVALFGACATLALLRYLRLGKRWLWIACVAAALSAASKYTGGIFLVPVLLVAVLRPPLASRVASLVLLCALFGAIQLVATPGLVLDTQRALADIAFEAEHYGRAGHGGSVIPGYGHHLRIITEFYLLQLPGPSTVVSALLFIAACGGAGWLWFMRRRLELGLVVLAPLALVALMASQTIFVPRNHLLSVTPIAVLSGVAIAALGKRRLLLAPVLLVFAAGAWGMATHLRDNLRGSQTDWKTELAQECARPGFDYRLSPALQQAVPTCRSNPVARRTLILLPDEYLADGNFSTYLPRRGRFAHFAGSRDVNRDYYFPFPTPEVVLDRFDSAKLPR